MVALKASAVLICLTAIGFGAPTPLVAAFLLRERRLPTFFGLFPMYGGGLFERWSPEVFALLLGAFAVVSALEFFAGVLLSQGATLGAVITLALLPLEILFWIGFALPIPPLVGLARLALLWAGWSSLR